ncbi:MAG: hypothetical protein RR319_00265 [Bacteroides sp.]
MKKKIKKSTWLTLALFLYVTVMAIYLIPRNHEIDTTEKIITVSASYVVVLMLWVVLRKKEKIAEEIKYKQEQEKEDKK